MLTYMYINICFLLRYIHINIIKQIPNSVYLSYIISPNHFFLIDITLKDKEMMKQDIRLNLNVKYGNIVPLYNLPSNVLETIVNNNMKKSLILKYSPLMMNMKIIMFLIMIFSTNMFSTYFSKLKQLNSHILLLFRNGMYQVIIFQQLLSTYFGERNG